MVRRCGLFPVRSNYTPAPRRKQEQNEHSTKEKVDNTLPVGALKLANVFNI